MKLKFKKDEYIYFLILVFVFIGSTALGLNNPRSQDFIGKFTSQAKIEKSYPSIPVTTTDSFPTLSAQGVLAVDIPSGVSLYEKQSDAKLLPASTTKIITALVSLDYFKVGDILTVGKMNVDGQRMHLYEGEKMKFEDVLKGLLVYSANDAAYVLAQNYNGGYWAFIDAMNKKAKELSMINTYFENPAGLDGTTQVTTARDLVRASEVAMRNPLFAQIVGTKETTVSDITGVNVYKIKNINELLGVVPGVLGVKTGWTENARENLVTYIDRDGHKIMIAVLGSSDRFGETKELIDWIFANYKWEKVTVRNIDQ